MADRHNLTRKSRLAHDKLEIIENGMNEIVVILKAIHQKFDTFKEDGLITENVERYCAYHEQVNLFVINGLPKRILFQKCGLIFSIDFTVISSGDGPTDIAGSITYGVCKKAPLFDCIHEKTMKWNKLKYKPLMQFVVDQHGMIQSDGKLQDEWLIGIYGVKEFYVYIKELKDMHYRTLEAIWKEALDWVNEDVIP